ncbi:DUF427 domain-containing protein [Streptomyces avicenniae]|uniref:DUF427 domain-containing protein n=1 Tax=Streptomyces avicenniae TaxID=500153 RepID=UPI00069C598C|nr:DUF427 domain-containing protein [Streptomyces avicenniae]
MGSGHTVEAATVERHVRVEIGGQVVAETRRPVLLKETGLPDRWYIPPADVRLDLLAPADLHTTCPFKGEASYWTLRGASPDRTVAWAYPEPIPSVAVIKDHLAFYDRQATVTVTP